MGGYSQFLVLINSKTLLFLHSPSRLAMAGPQTLPLSVYIWSDLHLHCLVSHCLASPVPCRIELEKQLNVHNMLEELHENSKIANYKVIYNRDTVLLSPPDLGNPNELLQCDFFSIRP